MDVVIKNPVGVTKLSESSMTAIEKDRLLQRKSTLAVLLSQVCILQRQYGKTKAELEGLVDGMLWALDDIEVVDITSAVREFVRENPNIPTPSDIIALIRSRRSVETAERYYENNNPKGSDNAQP